MGLKLSRGIKTSITNCPQECLSFTRSVSAVWQDIKWYCDGAFR